jgi:hypothetical protein
MLFNKNLPRSRTTKEMGISAMNDRPEAMSADNEQHQATNSPHEANEPQIPSRRDLIERYAKVAVVAAPLLVFVSKARAIHSKP